MAWAWAAAAQVAGRVPSPDRAPQRPAGRRVPRDRASSLGAAGQPCGARTVRTESWRRASNLVVRGGPARSPARAPPTSRASEAVGVLAIGCWQRGPRGIDSDAELTAVSTEPSERRAGSAPSPVNATPSAGVGRPSSSESAPRPVGLLVRAADLPPRPAPGPRPRNLPAHVQSRTAPPRGAGSDVSKRSRQRRESQKPSYARRGPRCFGSSSARW